MRVHEAARLIVDKIDEGKPITDDDRKEINEALEVLRPVLGDKGISIITDRLRSVFSYET